MSFHQKKIPQFLKLLKTVLQMMHYWLTYIRDNTSCFLGVGCFSGPKIQIFFDNYCLKNAFCFGDDAAIRTWNFRVSALAVSVKIKIDSSSSQKSCDGRE